MKLILAKLIGHRKTIEHVLTVLAIVCLIFSALAMAQGKFAFFAVTRGISMQPVFVNNDLILFAPYQLTKHIRPAKVGDIAVFRAPSVPPVWAHRIIEEVEPGVFLTKGDNNPHPDSFLVQEDNILGIVPALGHTPLKIPYAGWLMFKWQSNMILRWGSIAVLLVLLVAMPTESRRRLRKQISGRTWLLQKLGIAAGCALFFFVLTLYPFISRSGYGTIGYQVAEGDGISYGGSASVNFGIIKEGDSRSKERFASNDGVFPMIVYFQTLDDPYHEVHITPSFTILPPRSSATVEFQVEALEIGKWRQASFKMTTVPYIMPLSWITILSQKHPLLPNILVSGVSSLMIAVLVFLVLGRRRKRQPVYNRRYGRVVLLRGIVGGITLGALVIFGFLLPGILAATAQNVTTPASVSLTVANPHSTLASWGNRNIEIEAGTTNSANLFRVSNDYAACVLVEAFPIRNDGGILVDWTDALWLDSLTRGAFSGVLDAPEDLPPGRYLLLFEIRAFTPDGGLVAEWETGISVYVLPPPVQDDPGPDDSEGVYDDRYDDNEEDRENEETGLGDESEEM